MPTFNHVLVTVVLFQQTLLVSASPVTTQNNTTEQSNLINPTNLINQQVQDLFEHCSRPQKELLDLNHVLSGSYQGLLVDDYSELRDGGYELTPSLVLVERCDNTCKDDAGMTCVAQEAKNVVQELYFQDQDDKYHKLRVNEHTECQCTMDNLIHNISVSGLKYN